MTKSSWFHHVKPASFSPSAIRLWNDTFAEAIQAATPQAFKSNIGWLRRFNKNWRLKHASPPMWIIALYKNYHIITMKMKMKVKATMDKNEGLKTANGILKI